jgi:hypothetical protein
MDAVLLLANKREETQAFGSSISHSQGSIDDMPLAQQVTFNSPLSLGKDTSVWGDFNVDRNGMQLDIPTSTNWMQPDWIALCSANAETPNDFSSFCAGDFETWRAWF